jgi:hypothetical protein
MYAIMKNLTPTEKRNLLTDLILLKNACGYDLTPFIGYPLTRFDFDKVQNVINLLAKEYEEINGCEYSFIYSDRNIK